MKWHVRGAEKETGKDVTLIVEADSESSAADVADENGFLVASIALAPSPLREKQKEAEAPSYDDLERSGSVMALLSTCCFAIGLAGILATVGLSLLAANTGEASLVILTAAGGFVFVLYLFITSILLQFFSASANALRDMAVNSWN